MKRHFFYLDVSRFGAALLVAIGHVGLVYGLPVWGSLAPIGLSWFFVLSGFIIAYSCGDDTLRGSWRSYYLRRLIRIYPTYLLALLVPALALIYAYQAQGPGILAELGRNAMSTYDLPAQISLLEFLRVLLLNALFLPVLDPWQTAKYLFNSPLWSLYNEMAFYLLFPLLHPLLQRLPSRRACAVTLLLLWLTQLALVWLVVPTPATWQNTNAIIYTNPLIRLPEFVMGLTVFRLLQLHDQPLRGGAQPLVLLVVPTLVLLICRLVLVEQGFPYTQFAASSIFLAGGLYLLARLPSPDHYRRLGAWLGGVSYTLYCVHIPVLEWGKKWGVQQPWWLLLPCLLLAALIYQFYDAPVRARLQRRWFPHA